LISVFVIDTLIVVSVRCVSLIARGEVRSVRSASEAFAMVAVAVVVARSQITVFIANDCIVSKKMKKKREDD